MHILFIAIHEAKYRNDAETEILTTDSNINFMISKTNITFAINNH